MRSAELKWSIGPRNESKVGSPMANGHYPAFFSTDPLFELAGLRRIVEKYPHSLAALFGIPTIIAVIDSSYAISDLMRRWEMK